MPDPHLIAQFEQHPVPLMTGSPNHVLVPLVAQARLVGLLSLGPRACGGVYSQEELVFLMTLADGAAAAATNIRLLDRHTSEVGLDL